MLETRDNAFGVVTRLADFGAGEMKTRYGDEVEQMGPRKYLTKTDEEAWVNKRV